MTTTASPREDQLRLLAEGLGGTSAQLAQAITNGMDPTAFALELSEGGRPAVLARQVVNAPEAWRPENRLASAPARVAAGTGSVERLALEIIAMSDSVEPA